MVYRFTRTWAALLIWVGIACFVLGALLAVTVFVDPWKVVSSLVPLAPLPGMAPRGQQLVIALAPLLAGVLLGSGFVVAGEVLHVFLDQRQFLVRQYATIRRIEERLEFWELVRTGRDKSHAAALAARLKAADARSR